VGGWHLYDEVRVRLWLESALHRPAGQGANRAARVWTLQTEERFCALLADRGAPPGPVARLCALLEQGAALEAVRAGLLAALPEGGHVPLAALGAVESADAANAGLDAWLLECDTPPLVLLRGGEPVTLPVEEEDVRGHLVRSCRFPLLDGDTLALVNEAFIRPRGALRRWGWQEIAASVRRWTSTGSDAEGLLRALLSTYRRVAGGSPDEVCVLALRVRPLRTATVWTGPPREPALDARALDALLAETGTRIICGDTTAQIAARLLGARLELEPRPAAGWADVPPTSRLPGVDLVTEGLVTLRRAYELIVRAGETGDTPRGEDGAARLARLLLGADRITFLVGGAVNPVQAADAGRSLPMRTVVVQDIASALEAQGRLVHIREW
jgi:hypothetical protein